MEVITYIFDLRKKISANVELLRLKASKMAAFGVSLLEPILTLVIVANIGLAIQDEYGREFCQAMQVICCKYDYDHVHNATSVAFILKELAGADGVRNLCDVPDVNALIQQGAANTMG